MRSSSPDLTLGKYLDGSDPTYQVCAQLAQLSSRYSMGWIMGDASANPLPSPPRLPMELPPK